MKAFKLIFVLFALAVLVFGSVYMLVRNPEQRHIIEDLEVSGEELSADEREFLERYADSMAARPNIVFFNNAVSYTLMPERRANATQLLDYFATRLKPKLEVVIRSGLSQGTATSIANMPGLAVCYSALDSLATRIPTLRNTDLYDELKREQSLYNRIYAFSVRNHQLSPSFNLRVDHSGNISHGDIRNYQSYSHSQNNSRQQMLAELEQCVDIRNLAWIRPALAETTLNEKIRTAQSKYVNAERLALLRSLDAIDANTTLRSNAEASARAAEGLREVAASLPSSLATTEILDRMNAVATSLSSINQ